MEDKLISGPKSITSKHILKADIEVVWELLNNREFMCKDLMGDFVTSYEHNKDKHNKIGSETILHFKGDSINCSCTYLIEEPNYKKIKIYRCSKIENLNHTTTYTLISSTMEGLTIFDWEAEFEHPEILKMTSKILEGYKRSRLVFIKRFEEYLAKIVQYSQYESIMINTSRDELWEVITNWPLLRTISPRIADDVEVNGDQVKVGSQIKLIYLTPRNIISNFSVIKINNEIDSQVWEYKIGLKESTPKIPYQEIGFTIVYLNTGNSFLTFQHTYKERLNIQMLNNVSIDKKGILLEIKNYLEK